LTVRSMRMDFPAEHRVKTIESEAGSIPTRQLLARFITDIFFSILFFFLVFCLSWILNLTGKSWEGAIGILLQLFVLFLISCATICSLIFALQSAFEFFKRLRIARNKNSKI